TIICPEIRSHALFFELVYLFLLIRQVKVAPWFSRRVSEAVRLNWLVHSFVLTSLSLSGIFVLELKTLRFVGERRLMLIAPCQLSGRVPGKKEIHAWVKHS